MLFSVQIFLVIERKQGSLHISIFISFILIQMFREPKLEQTSVSHIFFWHVISSLYTYICHYIYISPPLSKFHVILEIVRMKNQVESALQICSSATYSLPVVF